MATAGFNLHTGPEPPVSNQAQGAEYGLPDTQIKGEGGAVRVQVPADLADRFEAAKAHAAEVAGVSGPSVDTTTHKSGFEEGPDRARDLTEVARAKMQTGGEAETRKPEIGFPARESQEERAAGGSD